MGPVGLGRGERCTGGGMQGEESKGLTTSMYERWDWRLRPIFVSAAHDTFGARGPRSRVHQLHLPIVLLSCDTSRLIQIMMQKKILEVESAAVAKAPNTLTKPKLLGEQGTDH